MYDMYPWDGAARSAAPAGSSAARTVQAADVRPAAEGARAVQIALDRRDNGGDAAAASQPTAGPTRQ